MTYYTILNRYNGDIIEEHLTLKEVNKWFNETTEKLNIDAAELYIIDKEK